MYITFYVSILFLVLTFFFVYRMPQILSQVAFNQFWQALTMYNKGNLLFKSLVFQLAGFPPMYIFYIKLNYLLTAFYTATFITGFFIFLNFLCGMLFYIQLFQTVSSTSNKQVLKLMCENNPLKTSTLRQKILRNQLKYHYLCWSFMFFSIFSFVFIPDVILLLVVYLGWY